MKIKKCAICGDEFMPNSTRQKYCNKLVIRKCANCGADYESRCTLTYSLCCSEKCRNEYAHKQSVAAYSQVKKTCVFCGKEFIPRNNTQSVCPDIHYRECVICGKSFSIDKYRSGGAASIPQTCSRECATKLRFKDGNPFSKSECREKAKQTMIDKYGVDHPMHSEELKSKLDAKMQDKYGVKRFPQLKEAYKEKSIQTNREKFGADWKSQTEDWKIKTEATLMNHYRVTTPMASPEIVAKMRDNYKEKTGYDNPLQNPEVQEKAKQTNKDRYGVEHALQSPSIQAHVRETMIDRYDAPYVLQSPKLVAKIHDTNMKKYGVPIATQNIEVKAKISNTMKNKYGYPYYSQTDNWLSSVMTDPSKIACYREFQKDPISFINSRFDHKPSLAELYEATGVGHEAITAVLTKFDCKDAVAFMISTMERDVMNVIKELKPGIVIEHGTHKIISPYEIDIYLPEYKIGIECNPTVTHNSSLSFICEDEVPTPRSYHKMKSDLAETNGVFIFHLFGYEWTYKRDIMISMIRNLINANDNRIYARNTEIREVGTIDAIKFLNINHRQGRVFSPVRLGLYDKKTGELVSLMTFGKLRRTMGMNKEASEEIWELTRFCNKLNTSVVGGASKLFKYFVDNYNPKEIRSFSDRAHTRGNLYSTLGFKELRRSDASYVWIDLKTDRAFHRIHAQKRNIRRFLNDPTIDIDNQTEFQIMESHGFVSLFDSGTITWQWTCDSL